MIMERLEQSSTIKDGSMDALCRSWTELYLGHLDLDVLNYYKE